MFGLGVEVMALGHVPKTLSRISLSLQAADNNIKGDIDRETTRYETQK